jgi:hypothetical protein
MPALLLVATRLLCLVLLLLLGCSLVRQQLHR